MHHQLLQSIKACACAAGLTLCQWLPASPALAQTGPFSGMAGNWFGSGRLTPANGASERIRCQVRYVVSDGGTSLAQSLRCVSDSYEIDATSKITHRDGVISGSWSEATRKISGKVTGEARNDSIAATVEGPGLTISLSIITRNQTQAASIKLQDASVAVTLTQE